MPEIAKLRWLPTGSSGLPRSARRGCGYDAYVPDPLVGRSFSLRVEVVADIAEAERSVDRLNQRAQALTDSEAVARLHYAPKRLRLHGSRVSKSEPGDC
jgi:hypothetical protein